MADSKKASELVTSMNLDLRPTQRYITAHDSNGKSVFSPSPELLYFNRGSYGVGWNYAVDRVPCVLQDNKDLQAFLTDDSASSSSYVHTGLKYTVAGGLTFATVDMAPGGQTTMHATVSLDFVCVIEGELVLELDSGEKQLLKSGDTVIQRQTLHRWFNPSQERPVRFMSVMIDSESVGATLKDIQIRQ